MKRGRLITFEGNEGSGKTTQIRLLHRYLKQKGRSVFWTREPGGTRIGDALRRVLLDPSHGRMSAVAETLLYMAARAQLVEEAIIPRLKKGQIVLCDRWLDATVAYQGYGGGVDLGWIRSLGKAATRGICPLRTVYLDLPLGAGLARARRRGASDRMERKARAFHARVRNGYLKIARKEPLRFRVVRVSPQDPIASVHQKILKSLRDVL
ncbi:MAG: dTMP kinase [Candidatus Omnitrophica bacterium]|nr:dTMP kinase [Candidatus Omnitrophota bacterium]